jgi:hypothetical protein
VAKADDMRAIVERRKREKWEGYSAVGDFHGGAYEADHVSPYTKCASNLDSPLFLLLQDWSSNEALAGQLDPEIQLLGYKPSLKTNVNLSRLVRTHFSLELSEVFATNLFPYVKNGTLSKAIPQKVLERAAEAFALPQIEVIQPRIVVCFGLATFNAIRYVCGFRKVGNVSLGIHSPFTHRTARIFLQGHPGHFGQFNRNREGDDMVTKDWEAMKMEYDQIRRVM